MSTNINLISIGSDRNTLKPDSAVAARLKDYGTLVSEMRVVVFASRAEVSSSEVVNLAPNVRVQPTWSTVKVFALFDAFMIGREWIREIRQRTIQENSQQKILITVQDPFESGLVGLALSLIYRVRLHVQVHTDIMNSHFILESPQNFLRWFVGLFVLSGAHHTRVVSKRIVESKIFRFISPRSRTSVLPIFVSPHDLQKHTHTHGNNHENNTPHEKPFPRTILVASRLESEKNVELALEVLQTVRKSIADAGLVIVGSGTREHYLKHYAQSLGLAEWVKWKGWKNDLKEEYDATDVALVTSKYEGYGMVFVEYAYAGLPIVTTEVGLIGDILMPDTDVLAVRLGGKLGQKGLGKEKAKEKLAEYVIRLLRDRDYATKMADSAYHAVKTKCSVEKSDYLKALRTSWEAAL